MSKSSKETEKSKKQPAKAAENKKGASASKRGAPPKGNKIQSDIKPGERLIVVEIKTHKDKNGGHPHVIVDNIDINHVSVGLTTQKKKGKNSPNYKLSNNPLGGKQESFMRRQGTVAPKEEYINPCEGAMVPSDFEKAKEYGKKAKQKYIEKKDKKK